METLRQQLKLYFVTGRPQCRHQPEMVLQEAIRGGVTMFQYREKGEGALQGEERSALGRRLKAICHKHGIPFIVNDDVELAQTLDADGIHVGQEDRSAADVRRMFPGKILGVSAHDEEEARTAVWIGADYLGVGPMYVTRTKADTRSVQGPDGIRRLREDGVDVPLVGIGGVTDANAGEVMRAGADGVAVISAISAKDDPGTAAARLKSAVRLDI